MLKTLGTVSHTDPHASGRSRVGVLGVNPTLLLELSKLSCSLQKQTNEPEHDIKSKSFLSGGFPPSLRKILDLPLTYIYHFFLFKGDFSQ